MELLQHHPSTSHHNRLIKARPAPVQAIARVAATSSKCSLACRRRLSRICKKGDAVMVVTTQGSEKDPPTVITLLAGVEPILRASPKGGQDMILSPWTLGGGEPSSN
jgi:hypothetical protein